MEKILASGRKFGLLINCDHIFCLDCIRIWRAGGGNNNSKNISNLRLCPICRLISYQVIPSTKCPADDEEKNKLIDM